MVDIDEQSAEKAKATAKSTPPIPFMTLSISMALSGSSGWAMEAPSFIQTTRATDSVCEQDRRWEDIFVKSSAFKSDVEREFNERADRWEHESKIHSSPGAKILHPDYQAIIGMGEKALPFILKRIETSRADWYWALSKIVRNNAPEIRLDSLEGHRAAWLNWAKQQK